MHGERLHENLESVRSRIASAARRAGREPSSVTLVAVTKRTPVELIAPLVACGVHDLGENYPQELWKKVEALGGLEGTVRWHLIGHLQGNKARKTLPLVRMIHAVDSLKLLQTLDELARDQADPPAVCLQVNTSGEETKHGWSPQEIPARRRGDRRLPADPGGRPDDDGRARRDACGGPRVVRPASGRPGTRSAIAPGWRLPELSMGMSADFEEAIAEGATLVRVGSALFEGVVG